MAMPQGKPHLRRGGGPASHSANIPLPVKHRPSYSGAKHRNSAYEQPNSGARAWPAVDPRRYIRLGLLCRRNRSQLPACFRKTVPMSAVPVHTAAGSSQDQDVEHPLWEQAPPRPDYREADRSLTSVAPRTCCTQSVRSPHKDRR
ncbi:hypothetical protein D3C86_1017820 [compost metagenome]